MSETDQIINILKSDLGIEVREVSVLPGTDLGDNANVFTGIVNEQQVFIKILSNDYSYLTETEGLKLFQKNNVPCPQIIGAIKM